jgi:hypothetical protein
MSGPHVRTPQFLFEGVSLPDGEDPLGIWDLSSSAPSAFAIGDEPSTLRWRIGLPGDEAQAAALLDARHAAVEARQSRLAFVERRLTDLVPAGLVPSERYGAQGAPTGLAQYDAELLEMVSALSAPATAFAVAAPEAHALYGQLYEACRELFSQFRKLLSHYARIETVLGGQMVAVTRVDWGGDFETLWTKEITATAMELHLEAVRLAMASRQTFLRLIAVATSGALGLALKASVPGGQFLLIPAVYRYVREVLKYLDEFGHLDERGA